jgi:hypothetical protein
MRVLDLTQVLVDFEGKPIPQGTSLIERENGEPVALVLEIQNGKVLADALGGIGLILRNNSEPTTLKRVLLRYFQDFNHMGMSEADQTTLFETGMTIGAATATVQLSVPQYDALKRMCDGGKRKAPNQPEEDIFSPVIKYQIKKMVDAAALVDENKIPVAETVE